MSAAPQDGGSPAGGAEPRAIRIGVPREVRAGERRVAATPETTARLKKLGFEVAIESGAGTGASFGDEDYEAAGATVVADVRELWAGADVILKVQPPELNYAVGVHEEELLAPGATLVSFLWPSKNGELVERLAARGATAVAMDLVPRITRAQKMDALSSMANVVGYRAVIEAASFFGRFFTGQMTAAGKIAPAKVLIIGAGVAGLAAIGAARGLGAIVRAFDTRPETRDQVESLGAEFLEVDVVEDAHGGGGYAKEMSPAYVAAEMALFAKQAKEVDIVITTASIPGRQAPLLLTKDTVELMKPGSVIIDLAAENGGNCELTKPGHVVVHEGVTVVGSLDLPSRLAPTASQLYGTNLCHLLAEMGGGKSWHVDRENEVVRSALVIHEGEITWPPPKSATPPPPAVAKATIATGTKLAIPATPSRASGALRRAVTALGGAALVALLFAIGRYAPERFLEHFSIFVLACVVGWLVVWRVTPALHTPLMSVTNAISGIILIGAMHQLSGTGAGPGHVPVTGTISVLAGAAVLLAAINVVGGFWVTQRMLRMFQR